MRYYNARAPCGLSQLSDRPRFFEMKITPLRLLKPSRKGVIFFSSKIFVHSSLAHKKHPCPEADCPENKEPYENFR